VKGGYIGFYVVFFLMLFLDKRLQCKLQHISYLKLCVCKYKTIFEKHLIINTQHISRRCSFDINSTSKRTEHIVAETQNNLLERHVYGRALLQPTDELRYGYKVIASGYTYLLQLAVPSYQINITTHTKQAVMKC